MKTIELTQGQFAIVDDDDFYELSKYKWHAVYSKPLDSYYAKRRYKEDDGYIHEFMHRNILGLKKGDKRIVDHINHETLDNRKENIRICTSSQNNWNTRKRKDNSTGLKGVSWNKRRQKYESLIMINKKHMWLGYFETKEEAHAVYMKAAQTLQGEFFSKDI